MADEDLELLFGQAPIGDMPLDLVFGDDDSVVIPPVLVNGGARITGIRRSVGARLGALLSANLKITGIRRPTGVHYDVNVDRPMVSQITTSAQSAQPADVPVSFSFEDGDAYFTGVRTSWAEALFLSAGTSVHFTEGIRQRQAIGSRFEDALRLGTRAYRLSFEDGIRRRVSLRTRFEDGVRVSAAPVRLLFQDGIRLRRMLTSSWDNAIAFHVPLHTSFEPAIPIDRWLRYPYQEAWPPRPGVGIKPEPPGPTPCYVPAVPVELLFDEPWVANGTNLVFRCDVHTPIDPEPPAQVVIPIRKVYLVINAANLIRVSDGKPIPVTNMNMSLDTESWTWSFSASGASTIYQDVAWQSGEPVEVQATVNGTAFRFVIENIGRDRTYREDYLRIGGRGRAALLDSPYSPILNLFAENELTSQQLAEGVLTDNGVPLGWDVNWGITPWSVPGGVFAHQGSYMSALNRIAEAAGAYVQPHNTADQVIFLPRYPVAPWEWGDVEPDFELPADVVQTEGTEWANKAYYNRVYVRGEAVGVNGRVTRSGSAGDRLAPPVVDSLITHAVAARQRGLAILSDVGRVTTQSLRMPVLPESGIIKPGKFVRYVDGGLHRIGLTRSVNVEVNLPVIWQTISLETHDEPV